MASSEPLVATIKKVLSRYNDLQLVILYGSGATGNLTGHSDVDLAVAFEHPMTADQKLDLAAALTVTLGREVDLTDLHRAKGIFLTQILSKGQVLINKNERFFTSLIREMLYFQADFYPYIKRIMKERRDRWIQS